MASFADADGDGVGDLAGITSRLPYLRDLGVDALWITPLYRSPQKDHGYDVEDYTDIDPLFGTLADADALVATAHELGLRVVVDLVPNHTSSEHEWFQAALASEPGSPERARYLFRAGQGTARRRSRPTTGARSSAATRGRGCRTAPTKRASGTSTSSTPPSPTSTGATPRSATCSRRCCRFWLDRGVDGFRVDVAHGLVKEASLRDQVVDEGEEPSSGVDLSGEHAMVGAHDARRADVGPARGARRLPTLAPGAGGLSR